MFTYTKEVIINSLIADADAYGSTQTLPRITAEPGLLRILRSGEYKQSGIQGAKIFKTPGVAGSTSNILIPNLGALLATPGVYRITVYIGMAGQYLGDFAHANWYPFGKPLMADFSVSAGMSDAEKMTQMYNALNLTVPYNNIFARVIQSGTDVTVDLTNPYAFVARASLDYYNPELCGMCSGTYEEIPEFPGLVTITPNVQPFATAQWLIENLRFPSYPNLRYAALNAEEYPIRGQMYTQYSFAYDVERPGYYGISGVNEKMAAVTRHVYYVLNSLVAEFETLVDDAFPDVDIVENFSVFIVSAPTIANDGVSVALVADSYPADPTATYTWTGAGLPTGVTLTSGGVLTAVSTATVGSTFTVTATSSNPDYKPATRTFTVVAG